MWSLRHHLVWYAENDGPVCSGIRSNRHNIYSRIYAMLNGTLIANES